MNVKEILKNVTLDREEKKVIETLYEQLQQGKDKVSIRQLASQTYVSTSSIVRLAKRLGFYGYSDMVFSFKKYQKEVIEFNDTDTLNPVIISSESLKIVDELVDDILSGNYKRFHFQGLGYSDLVCKYIVNKLVEMEYFATEVNPMDVNDGKDSCIAVFVSKSGETNDFYKIIDSCKNKGYKMYVICSQENSTICQKVQHNIIISQKDGQQTNSYFTGNAIILMEKIATAVYNYKK